MFIFVSALKIYYYTESLKNQIEAILLTTNIFQSYLYNIYQFLKKMSRRKMSKKPEKQSYTIYYNAFAFAHNLL